MEKNDFYFFARPSGKVISKQTFYLTFLMSFSFFHSAKALNELKASSVKDILQHYFCALKILTLDFEIVPPLSHYQASSFGPKKI